ncbi:MAG TPA: hypothetical protein VHE11_13845, partial [Steroidobacteraceae bacterium]|nr:hypothetical protein [Steroidobacteraceae bacterium]
MQNPASMVGWLWAGFVLYWLVLAQSNKKASSNTPWWSGWGLRLAVVIGALAVASLRRPAVAGF